MQRRHLHVRTCTHTHMHAHAHIVQEYCGERQGANYGVCDRKWLEGSWCPQTLMEFLWCLNIEVLNPLYRIWLQCLPSRYFNQIMLSSAYSPTRCLYGDENKPGFRWDCHLSCCILVTRRKHLIYRCFFLEQEFKAHSKEFELKSSCGFCLCLRRTSQGPLVASGSPNTYTRWNF